MATASRRSQRSREKVREIQSAVKRQDFEQLVENAYKVEEKRTRGLRKTIRESERFALWRLDRSGQQGE